MKVLFAVSNEEISESIVKKYQKEYKQIISYKNVYYFNAILKEIQKDKTYDRIVISEDLEAFTHTQYDQIDKFIFDKLDSISDEASNIKGNGIPIILICSDRRTKSEQILVKLFGIGIYNAIIGNDRSVDEVCKLINRPRVKKEAKTYYKIDSDDVNYQAENENDVSEMEIQNIIAHYKRLGKNEDRYVDSFNNIAAQYNDTQLRIISKFLPLNVRAVLEEKSPKYQQVMSFNNSISNNLRTKNKLKEEGPSEVLLKTQNREKIMTKPVVIPSAVNMSGNKKLSKPRQVQSQPVEETYYKPEVQQKSETEIKEKNNREEMVNPIYNAEQEVYEEENVQPVKRGRGRPRKNPVPEIKDSSVQPVKRGRGRPRKNPVPVVQEVGENVLPGLDDEEIEQEETFLPGFEQNNYNETINEKQSVQEETFLPGFEEEEQEEDNNAFLPGFENVVEDEPTVNYNQNNYNNNYNNNYSNNYSNNYNDNNYNNSYNDNYSNSNNFNNKPIIEQEDYEEIDLSNLLTPDKKIITFVGTSKNGTSFIVNNIAQLMSSIGINTAILDTTRNRNAYYIYTKNEEQLRETASKSIEGLTKGITNGIKVNNNLTVYTSLPNENEDMKNVDRVLETLVKNYSLILIDTDFDTPLRYFKQSQETYLVQTMDVLTIQPLTAFLKELKGKNILDEKKLRIILNKNVRIRGIKDETIIGGMAFYNDPAMSFMTELFDRDRVKYVSIPFEEETYIRYLEGVIDCEISLKGYSKVFLQTLKELGNMIYPMVSAGRNNTKYTPPSAGYNGNRGGNFSSDMNNTLNRMKNSY